MQRVKEFTVEKKKKIGGVEKGQLKDLISSRTCSSMWAHAADR
jgi:hypothetical protein